MMDLPDKIFFKIGEVAEIVGVKPHVLRYWETEFPAVRPVKTQGNQRLYRKSHVEQLLRLKDLLYCQGFTLAGAKKHLKAQELPLFDTRQRLIHEIHRDLRQLRDSLEP